jgi:hypothetical protein
MALNRKFCKFKDLGDLQSASVNTLRFLQSTADITIGMQIDALLWILLPLFIAAGSALLSYYIMQARMDVAVAKEREVLAETRAEVRTQKNTMEERVKATEQEARRRALDDFMQDFRVEERHYFRENKSLAARRKSMVLQERLYFRNIPLSNWVEHEMTVEEESGDVQRIAKGCSVFTTKSLSDEKKAAVSRMLGQAPVTSVVPEFAEMMNDVQAG